MAGITFSGLTISGGAGPGVGSAGGGAGGYRTAIGYSVTAGTPYTVTVGTGGIGSGQPGNGANNGLNGDNSVFATITAAGGGGGGASGRDAGGNGGSGIVIIRYADTLPNAAATTGSPTLTTTGGYKYYTFTASGSITF